MKALVADMVQAKETVKMIAGLDFDTLLVGHGAPVKGDAAAKVKKFWLTGNKTVIQTIFYYRKPG